MNQKEAEAIIEVCLGAVNEQYVMPLMLALGTLTATMVCRDPDAAPAIAATLRDQAESCPPDVAGRVLLQSLALLAETPRTQPTEDLRAELRASLRLIQGGKRGPEPEGGGPAPGKR